MISSLDTLRMTGKVLHIGLISEPFDKEQMGICWEIYDCISVVDRNEPDHLVDWHWGRHNAYRFHQKADSPDEPKIDVILRWNHGYVQVLPASQTLVQEGHFTFPEMTTENVLLLDEYLAGLDPQFRDHSENSSTGQSWPWGIGIMTCDQRPKSTLQRTLENFRGTGFATPEVFADLKKQGSIWNWHRAMFYLVEHYPDAKAYAILEDDIICAKDIREYLEQELWPDVSEHGCICSIFTPTIYLAEERWHTENRGQNTWMSQFWVFHPLSARKLLQDIPAMTEFQGNKQPNDTLIGKWAIDNKVTIWHHSPSLVQHTGYNNSYGKKLPTNYRIGLSREFVGENFSAKNEMPFWNKGRKPRRRIPKLDVFVNRISEENHSFVDQWTPEQAEHLAKKMNECNCDIGEIRFIGDEPLLWSYLHECTEILRFTGKVMHIGLETELPSQVDPSPFHELLDGIYVYETEDNRDRLTSGHPVYRYISSESNRQQRSCSKSVAPSHYWVYEDRILLASVEIALAASDTLTTLLNDSQCQNWDMDHFFESIPEKYGCYSCDNKF